MKWLAHCTTNTNVPESIPVPGRKHQGLNFSSPLTPFAIKILRNDDSPSEVDDKWLTRVKREPYLLHVKYTFVDFEKEQAYAATGQHSHPQSGKRLI